MDPRIARVSLTVDVNEIEFGWGLRKTKRAGGDLEHASATRGDRLLIRVPAFDTSGTPCR